MLHVLNLTYCVKQLACFVQICRVEDIAVEGHIKGSVVHFHRARTVSILTSGTISSSGMGILSKLCFTDNHLLKLLSRVAFFPAPAQEFTMLGWLMRILNTHIIIIRNF